MRSPCCPRTVVAAHEQGVADHVSRDDRCESSLVPPQASLPKSALRTHIIRDYLLTPQMRGTGSEHLGNSNNDSNPNELHTNIRNSNNFLKAGFPGLSRQPGNEEEVGVEHVEPGKNQHQAAGDLQHSPRTLEARAAFEPAHRRRTKHDRDGAANTESE